MPSFRRRIQRVSLYLITVLMGAFSALLYVGLSTILYTHVDNDLRLLTQAEAKHIELATGQFFERSHREEHDPSSRTHDDHDTDESEYDEHELREAIRSSVVLSPEGTILWTGEYATLRGPVSQESLRNARQGKIVFETIPLLNDSSIRRIFFPILDNGEVRYILQSNTSLRFVEDALQWLLVALAVVSGVVLLLAWIGSSWLARQALAPIEQLSQTAAHVSGHNLDTRLSMTAPYVEFHHLAQAFNSMLDRLQKAFDAQHRFVADAAHELKTPLTAMKGHMEVILQKPRTVEEYREAIGTALGDTDRLHQLTKSLLTLAHLSGNEHTASREPINLQPIIEEVCGELRILAEDQGIVLKVETTTVPTFLGDALQLRRMIVNLLDNALRYTPKDGTVTIRVAQDQDHLVLSVTDTGCGIAPKHLPHVFDRFYRVDSARDRQSGGTGLGLALVQEIAEAHGGHVEVCSEIGTGSTFTISLPVNTQ